MDKPFEFDIGEKVMLALGPGNKLGGPFTIVSRRAGGTFRVPDELISYGYGPGHSVDNRYEVRSKRISSHVFTSWYLERNLRRTVLDQLVRAVRNRRLSHERKTEIKERKTSESEAI